MQCEQFKGKQMWHSNIWQMLAKALTPLLSYILWAMHSASPIQPGASLGVRKEIEVLLSLQPNTQQFWGSWEEHVASCSFYQPAKHRLCIACQLN